MFGLFIDSPRRARGVRGLLHFIGRDLKDVLFPAELGALGGGSFWIGISQADQAQHDD